MPRHTNDRRIRWNAPQHDRPRPHADVVANGDIAQHFPSGADGDVVAERGMSLAFLYAGTTERHALIERDIVSHNGRLADHRAHAVVDEQTPSYLCPGMNLNAREQARHLRNESRQEAHTVPPQPMA